MSNTGYGFVRTTFLPAGYTQVSYIQCVRYNSNEAQRIVTGISTTASTIIEMDAQLLGTGLTQAYFCSRWYFADRTQTLFYVSGTLRYDYNGYS